MAGDVGRKNVSENPVITGRLERALRFDNYLVLIGWLPPSLRDGTVWAIEADGQSHEPQHAFARMTTGLTEVVGPISRVVPLGRRFMLCRWINDIYRFQPTEERPLVLRLKAPDEETARTLETTTIADKDYEGLIEACDGLLGAADYGTAFLCEIVRNAPASVRLSYIHRAGRLLDAGATRTAARTLYPALSEAEIARMALAVLVPAARAQGRDRLQPGLAPHVATLLEATDWTLEDQAVAPMVELLGMLGDEKAVARLVRRTVASVHGNRGRIATILGASLPSHSRWWVRHALEHRDLGDEQAADALNAVGVSLAANGTTDLALAAFDAAVAVNRDAQSPMLNGGWLSLEMGRIDEATAFFSGLGRQFTSSSIATVWPTIGGARWPHAPLDSTHLDALNAAAKWPKISIVVPTLNQGTYIEETILSILNQRYPNLELIVVDGASTDNTREILSRYKRRITVTISERDGGQTEAINKGLRRASGALVAWLNSDDMYAPGALHMAALTHIREGADLISGVCLEHQGQTFRLVNKPAAKPDDLTPDRLSGIFSHWLNGHFFFQPEVFFTKALLDRAGPLDESLHYTMDYDLWLRFAKVGAQLSVVSWPFAFFRKHDAQKTAQLVECLEEQAVVRGRAAPITPSADRLNEIERRLDLVRQSPRPSVAVVSTRLAELFSGGAQDELDAHLGGRAKVRLTDSVTAAGVLDADLVITIVHLEDDLANLAILRKAQPNRAIVGWFWDAFRLPFENYAIAEALDVAVPAHKSYSEYLRNTSSRLADPVPLATTRWSGEEARRWFDDIGARDRASLLFGQLESDAFAPQRDALVARAQSALGEHALTVVDSGRSAARLGMDEPARFEQWCGFKASLIVPQRHELPQQVFDALLAGQIPLVPEGFGDLDLVFSRAQQESLPIVRYTTADATSIKAAHLRAINLYDKGGAAGARARHEHASEHHTLAARIAAILRQLGCLPTTTG